jgi:hypothetical protein
MSVSIEYDLSDSDLELEDVIIRVPLEWVYPALLANRSWLKYSIHQTNGSRDQFDFRRILSYRELPRVGTPQDQP